MTTLTKEAPTAVRDAAEPAQDAMYFLARAVIHPDPKQPRTHLTDESIAALRQLLVADGAMTQPVTVRPHPDLEDAWMLVDGERRWRASEGVFDEIPCRIRLDLEDPVDRLRTQLNANSGEPMTPLDEARAYRRLLDDDAPIALAEGREPMSQVQLAKMLGKPRASIGDRLRLLEIGPWLELLEAGKLTVSQAVECQRFAGVPERFARKAMKDATHRHGFGSSHIAVVQDFDFSKVEVIEFRRMLAGAFAGYLYPLQADRWGRDGLSKTEQKRHDAECPCGRIRYLRHEDRTPATIAAIRTGGSRSRRRRTPLRKSTTRNSVRNNRTARKRKATCACG
jgi:ParB/RepB/Spo0J family partition protein